MSGAITLKAQKEVKYQIQLLLRGTAVHWSATLACKIAIFSVKNKLELGEICRNIKIFSRSIFLTA